MTLLIITRLATLFAVMAILGFASYWVTYPGPLAEVVNYWDSSWYAFWDSSIGVIWFALFGKVFPGIFGAYLVMGMASVALFLALEAQEEGAISLPPLRMMPLFVAAFPFAVLLWPYFWIEFLPRVFERRNLNLWTEKMLREEDEYCEKIRTNPEGRKEKSLHEMWVRRGRPRPEEKGTLEERVDRINAERIGYVTRLRRADRVFAEPLAIFMGLMVAVVTWRFVITA